MDAVAACEREAVHNRIVAILGGYIPADSGELRFERQLVPDVELWG
jgi:hypothetical protein